MFSAWNLFYFSVRMVFENVGKAIRVSGILYAVLVGLELFGYQFLADVIATDTRFSWYSLLALLVYLFLNIAAGAWLAIAWHRFILRDELGISPIPNWPAGRMLGYVGRSLLIGGIVALVFVIVYILGFAVFGLGIGSVSILVQIPIATMGGTYISLRLGLILPAYAVGQPMLLRTAWGVSKKNSRQIFLLALIVWIAGALIVAANLALTGLNIYAPAAFICRSMVNWIVMMVWLNLLTTIYGHYVEGRAIG